jgi:steroid delta-isomerase-like uncharacterized protein
MNNDKSPVHRNAIRKIFDRAWNEADFDGIDELIADDAKFHIRRQTAPTNAQDLKRIVAGWHGAFPDFRFTIEDMVAEDDLVAIRLTLSGTHEGQWQSIPATGKKISVTAMMFFRFENGQVAEIWEDYDEYGMRKQLGQE